MQEGQDNAVVRIGTETYRADLVDVSAEVFAVTVRDLSVPGKNLIVELECMTGRHEARVARWERIDGMIRLRPQRIRDLRDGPPAAEPMPEQKLLEEHEQTIPIRPVGDRLLCARRRLRRCPEVRAGSVSIFDLLPSPGLVLPW